MFRFGAGWGGGATLQLDQNSRHCFQPGRRSVRKRREQRNGVWGRHERSQETRNNNNSSLRGIADGGGTGGRPPPPPPVPRFGVPQGSRPADTAVTRVPSPCRLCGRPFCYYCCSNTVSTLQGGGGGGGAAGNRERCCRHCYDQHSAVVERHPQEQDANAPDAPFGALPQPGDRAAAGEGGGERGVLC